MADLVITSGAFSFPARLEAASAPLTVAAFRGVLPFESRIVHVRWSGEGVWIPLGERSFGVGFENATSYPAPGQVLLHPGGPGMPSETEILIAYGPVAFASKAGSLAGNHFLTLTEGLAELAALGRRTLWEGAQPIRFALA